MTTMATRLVYRAARGLPGIFGQMRARQRVRGVEGMRNCISYCRKRYVSKHYKWHKRGIRIGERAYRAGKEDTDTGRR
jgi:hypothetical protein